MTTFSINLWSLSTYQLINARAYITVCVHKNTPNILYVTPRWRVVAREVNLRVKGEKQSNDPTWYICMGESLAWTASWYSRAWRYWLSYLPMPNCSWFLEHPAGNYQCGYPQMRYAYKRIDGNHCSSSPNSLLNIVSSISTVLPDSPINEINYGRLNSIERWKKIF